MVNDALELGSFACYIGVTKDQIYIHSYRNWKPRNRPLNIYVRFIYTEPDYNNFEVYLLTLQALSQYQPVRLQRVCREAPLSVDTIGHVDTCDFHGVGRGKKMLK